MIDNKELIKDLVNEINNGNYHSVKRRKTRDGIVYYEVQVSIGINMFFWEGTFYANILKNSYDDYDISFEKIAELSKNNAIHKAEQKAKKAQDRLEKVRADQLRVEQGKDGLWNVLRNLFKS